MIHHFRLAQSHLPLCYRLHLSLFRGTPTLKDPNQILYLKLIIAISSVFIQIFISFAP